MGPSAAYRVEGLCDDGSPASSGVEGRRRAQLSLCSAPTMPFSSQADSVAEELPESKPWCVDHGDWLEAMSTVALWRALEAGALPHATRVWREGLECWTPAGEVKALGWTLSQPPPAGEVCAVSAAGEGVESTGPLSFALTPDDLRTVAPRPSLSAPASSDDGRAEAFTLGRFPLAEVAAQHETPSPPISIEIPASFPAVPSCGPDTLPSAGAARPGALKPRPGPARDGRAADRAPRGRASGIWSTIARRARAHRSSVSLAAGSAALVLALGLSALSALAPTGPRTAGAAATPAAHAGIARGVAAAAAHVGRPEVPELARPAAAAAQAHDTAAAQAHDTAAAQAHDTAAAQAHDTAAAQAHDTAAASVWGTAAAAAPLSRAGKAPAPAVKLAPAGRRERGQFRLRRGRSEADTTRGISHPGRGRGSSIGTGAILRDSR
ncbi:hypothetical protein SOCE26_093450 [Sorangium cellulosum]|uniref:Uncharacterized protein n=1 Tax=Sorangium cellulosum TaxID=56 RepID=A0A2L0F8J8_SORCE|nr:hypothetical protein [Sorangium cellulosum]AUX47821.1 hypothetical protein SOCE26_093450 [Sorangium cellulosum]